MTREELKQIRSLKLEVKEDTRRRAELWARATSTTSVFTGMPMCMTISDKTALAAEIADLDAKINQNIARRYAEYKRLYDEIQAIPDSRVRRALQYYYVDGLTWLQVAFRMGKYSENYAKKICSKYFNKNNM